MWISKRQTVALIALLMAGLVAPGAGAADTKEAKPVMLPKDSKAVVASLFVTGGMIKNKTDAPFLQIQADGRVVVTDRTTGEQKETKLTAEKLQDLLRFVVQEQDFLDLTDKKITEAVTDYRKGKPLVAFSDVSHFKVRIQANDKEQTVACTSGYTDKERRDVKLLARFFAVNQRLLDLAESVRKQK